MTAEIAPEAPIIGIREDGSSNVCAHAAVTPPSR